MGTLDVAARIETPTGWLELDDPAGGYELEGSSFSEANTTHRKTEVSGEWVEGTYTVRSVRENITETVAVWVTGATPYELSTRIKALTDAFDQNSYSLVVRFADLEETWSCQLADYTVTTQREFRFATIALVKATVPHLPTKTLAQVTP